MKIKLTERQVLLSVVALLGILGFAVYSNSFNVPFYFDDVRNVTHPSLRMEEFSVDQISKALTDGTLRSRPVSNLSFALNYYVGEFRVQGYHLVNTIIHIISGALLFLLARKTLVFCSKNKDNLNTNLIASFTAILWLVHPVGTQSVTYIVQRMNSMAAMFYVLSLLLYVTARTLNRESSANKKRLPAFLIYLLSLFVGLLALGSKEIAATLPLTIFLYEWFFIQDLSLGWIKKKRFWIAGILGGVLLSTWVYTGGHLIQRTIHGYGGRDFSLTERLFTQLRVVVHYLSLLIYPHPDRLVLDYDFPLSTSFFSPVSTFYSAIFLFLFFAGAICVAKKERLVSFCILWFFINLLIESTVVPLEMVYEHRLYLPSMFMILLLVYLLFRVMKSFVLPTVLLVLLSLTLSAWTYQRNAVWKNPVELWQSSIQNYPENYRVHANLGAAYMNINKLDDAEVHLRRAIALKPETDIAYSNLGLLLLSTSRRDEAREAFLECLQNNKSCTPALKNLALMDRKEGKYSDSIEKLIIMSRQNPDKMLEIEIWKNLGLCYLRDGSPDKAVDYFERVVGEKDDDPEAMALIAEAYMRTGDNVKAIEWYRRSLREKQSDGKVHYNLAELLVKEGDYKEAETHYSDAVEMLSSAVPVEYNYANFLLRTNQFPEAENHYRAFLGNSNVTADAMNNLGLALVQQGKMLDASIYFKKAYILNPEHSMALENYNLAKEILSSGEQKAEQ